MSNTKISKTALALVLFLIASLAVFIFLSKTTLTVDGKSYTHFSLEKQTVEELLKNYQIVLGPKDIVSPALDQRIGAGSTVRVIRVSEKTETKKETVNFILNWKRRTSKNLRRVEIQQGFRRETTWMVHRTFHDGKEVETKKIATRVKKTPVTRLLLLKEKGRIEKIYDLSRAKKMRMIATAYWVGDPQVPGVITFSGHLVERGLVAVDPQVIPLGFRLYIPGYGYAYSSDTGSAIKGNRIDLFVESKEASRKWEYVKVDVYLLEKAKKW